MEKNVLQETQETQKTQETQENKETQSMALNATSLQKFFSPDSIAVIGARNREKKVGGMVFKNLLRGNYKGQLYAVNPKHKTIQGQPCVASVIDIKSPVDLAVIATPAATIPGILVDCGKKGIENILILSAGFSESGDEGKKLEAAILDLAKQYNMRIMGPNCLGIIIPSLNINASFSNIAVHTGQLALVSQSGAICAAILDWAAPKKIGFSSIVSLGNVADIDFGDVLEYLAFDVKTQSILLYIEGVRNARGFMQGLRLAANKKPVIVIKAGRSQQGSVAATTHTGALIGEDDVFDSALKRAGAVRVTTIEQLFTVAQILSQNYRVKGNNLCIITNGGGAGVMAADAVSEYNINLASLDKNTILELDKKLPKFWSHHNPVDILGDATSERYQTALSLCQKDKNVDGLLAILVPVVMSDPHRVAKSVIEIAGNTDKPILTCWMGQQKVQSDRKLFLENNIPSFDTPEKAVEAFSFLTEYHRNQTLLLQVANNGINDIGIHDIHQPSDRSTFSTATISTTTISTAKGIIDLVLSQSRTILTLTESKSLLAAFGIKTTKTLEAHSPTEALKAGEVIGYPLAMKILSPDITHKTECGGVELNIVDSQILLAAYKKIIDSAKEKKPTANILGVTLEPMYIQSNARELMVGVFRDKVFGPVVSFGLGGTLVEVLKDRAVALPPINRLIAKQLIEQTRAAKILGKFRNMPEANRQAIEEVLIQVSTMVCELPEIKEMDINPLIANEKEAIALDVRIVVAK